MKRSWSFIPSYLSKLCHALFSDTRNSDLFFFMTTFLQVAFKTDVSGGCFGYLRLKTLSELDPDLKGELRVPVLVTTGGQSCGKTTFIQAGRLAFHQEK